ncbi:MAG: alpha/beta hydrolase, partial [Bacteroidetes bacterium]|nr:alpha/beta hydrolase [Bacteroidota bacterium]
MKHALVFALLLPLLSFFQTKPAQPLSAARPFVLGEITELNSTTLNEKRTLNIYLPEGYNPKDTVKYPVIYLLDGSADEDFIHITGLVQFNSFEWVNRLPKSIVVGIATVDRKRDFTFPTKVESDRKKYPTTGHSDKFIAFIEKELQPFVNARYKASASKTLIGESLGGLLATEILFTKPALFNKYIIVSPSLWWDNGSLLAVTPAFAAATGGQAVSGLPGTVSPVTEVYIGVGKEGLTPTEPARVMEVDANLLAEKVRTAGGRAIKVYFDYLPAENHATIMH